MCFSFVRFCLRSVYIPPFSLQLSKFLKRPQLFFSIFFFSALLNLSPSGIFGSVLSYILFGSSARCAIGVQPSISFHIVRLWAPPVNYSRRSLLSASFCRFRCVLFQYFPFLFFPLPRSSGTVTSAIFLFISSSSFSEQPIVPDLSSRLPTLCLYSWHISLRSSVIPQLIRAYSCKRPADLW